jgi:hypothetical protein
MLSSGIMIADCGLKWWNHDSKLWRISIGAITRAKCIAASNPGFDTLML